MAKVKKVYPIEGRKDFFKFVIVKTGESYFNDNAKLQRDFKGDEMYFDCQLKANTVCRAVNKVESKKLK